MNRVFCAILLLATSAAVADEPRPYSSREAWQSTIPQRYQSRPEFAFLEADPELPNVLLIGDSISMSYTVGVRNRLAGKANVYRAADNCRSTRQTLAEIETYLGGIDWDVIHFNWGIHDVTHLNKDGRAAPPPDGSRQVSLEQYRRNFQALIKRLKGTDAQLVWASTTPIGKKTEDRRYRRDQDVVSYNAAAAEIVQAENIPSNDLYGLVKPRAEELLSDGVHFNQRGTELLSQTVADAIVAELKLDEPREKCEAQAEATEEDAIELPAKENFHLFLLMGQSNMVGRGELTRLPTTPRVLAMNNAKQWQLAVDPLHETGPRDRVGPGISFAQEMLDVVEKDVVIGLIPCAVGGTPLSRWQRDGDLYAAAVQRARAAGKHGTLKGVLWLQGERDAKDMEASKTYAARLQLMIHDLRTDLDQPKLPFIAGEFCEEISKRDDRPGAALVIAALKALPTKVPQTACVDSVGLKSLEDHVHFSTPAQRELGRRYARSMAALLGKEVQDVDVQADAPETTSSKTDALAHKLLGASESQWKTYAEGKEKGLISVSPIHMPIDPPGDCNHFGWPIATMVGDTIIVMHRRIPGHNPRGAGKPHEQMTYGIVLRSEDRGKTWSQPRDLRDFMKPEDRLRGGLVPLSHRFKFEPENKSKEGYKIHLHAIGTTRDGGVVAINNHGVFRSDDRGKSWKHFPLAFREDKFPHELVNFGPNIIDHPEHGLLAFGNWFGKGDRPTQSDHLVVLQSRDGGESWEAKAFDVGFRQYEPAVMLHEGKFFSITRDQTSGRVHREMTWEFGEPPTIDATNMKNPRYVDTVDLCYNPVTGRFEVVRSQRHNMELWLWSIDPKDWKSGEWKRECRLLARDGRFYRDADGFHPASAVVDAERGVQHIFIYAGHPNGPTGIFQITRTLDTPKLAAFLAAEDGSTDE